MTESDEDPSVLGTLQHWDEVYCSELRDLQETGDEGEIWCDHVVWWMALYSHEGLLLTRLGLVGLGPRS